MHGSVDNRQGGVVPKKGTVVLVSGLSDDPQKDIDKCAAYKCPMVMTVRIIMWWRSVSRAAGSYTQAP